MELTELIARVEDAGITVAWVPLSTCNAGWDAPRRTIWMRNNLYSTPRRAVSILAHEWAHALLGHEGPQSASEEARADTVAAGMLICPGAYRRAELAYEGDPHLIALELGVSERLVRTYQASLARAD